jgi:nucleoside phosphorylase
MEASPFLKMKNCVQTGEKPFRQFSIGDLRLIISGIGKGNAAIAASYAINVIGAGELFNIGAAGSTTPLLAVGEIRQISKIVEYDRVDIPKTTPVIHNPDTIEGFPSAVLATQDKPVITPEDRESVSAVAELVDMEGAGFAHACRLLGAHGWLFKIVTDTPEHGSSNAIIENIKKTRDTLFNFFMDDVMKNRGRL